MVTLTNGRHFGRLGLRMRCMPDSVGVRLALRVLQAMQAQTMFSHVVVPPRSRGMTWSRFSSRRSQRLPQYWQVLGARSEKLWRLDLTSLCGRGPQDSSRVARVK